MNSTYTFTEMVYLIEDANFDVLQAIGQVLNEEKKRYPLIEIRALCKLVNLRAEEIGATMFFTIPKK